MKFEEGQIYFNHIYVLQSLRRGERNTAQELYDDIIRWRTSDSMQAEIVIIQTKADLFASLDTIFRRIRDGRIPFLHFEMHGYLEGLQVSSDEVVTWAELVPIFRKINTAIRNNLFISVAACQGGNIQFGVKIMEPCPFRGFIGPMQDVYPLDVLYSFSEFFNSLLTGNDFEKAVEALNFTLQGLPEPVHYHHMNVEAFFEFVWEYQRARWTAEPNTFKVLIKDLVQDRLAKMGVVADRRRRRELERKYEKDIRGSITKLKTELRDRFCHINQEARVNGGNPTSLK